MGQNKWLLAMLIQQLILLFLYYCEAHFVNGSLHPWPSPIRNFSKIESGPELLYELPDRDCYCRAVQQQTMTLCYGQDCVAVPQNVTIYRRTLRVTGTSISSLSQTDFVGYGELLDLQLDGNEINTIADRTFQDLIHLVNLSVSFNELEMLGVEAFFGLESLRNLRLVANQFASLGDVVPAMACLPQLAQLTLSENALSRIDACDFTPLSHSPVESLELANCDLKYIHSEAFLPLKKLRRLQLSENTMPDDNLVHLFYMLKQSSLENLDLSHLFAGNLPRALLDVLSRSNVTELNLKMNTLPRMKTTTFPLMPNIARLDLSHCGMIDIEDGSFHQLPRLKRLNLASNTLLAVPQAVVLPQLEYLSLSDNSGGWSTGGELELGDGSFQNMTNLTFLDLSHNRIGQIPKDAFVGLARLEVLQLMNASLYRLADGCFKPLVSVKVLRLDGNYLDRQNLSRAIFQGLWSLEHLNLDNCQISNFGYASIFADSPKLRTLSLRQNLIQKFNQNPFLDAPSLVSIDLTSNRLREWNTTLFNSSKKLEHLILSNNQIFSATDAMVEDFVHLQEVDLFGNPLDCDCQLTPLKFYALDHQVDSNQSQVVVKVDLCSSPDEWRFRMVVDFFQTVQDKDCQVPAFADSSSSVNLMVAYVVAPLTVLMLVIVAILVTYKWRWLIRYYFFRQRMKQQSNLRNQEADGEYQYDAFVSYSNEDHAFVVRLVTMMENQSPHYKLCVYERDFTAGTVLNDCIIHSITNSRKVVLVISQHFVHSQWCLWELHLAQHSLLEEKREGLILIVVGKLKVSNLPPTLRFLMKTRIYLDWDPDPAKQHLFWARLRTALSPPKKSFSNPSPVVDG